MDPDVRRATESDLAQLAALEGGARQALVNQRGGGRWLETHPARSSSWPAWSSTVLTFVAWIDAIAVGYLVLRTDSPVATIDDVYVAPWARELGNGDALIEAAVDAGRQAGCTSIEGEALPGDRDTKNLYERASITARLIVVARAL